jgi:hypothetical protein
MMSSNTRSDGTRIGLQPSEPSPQNVVFAMNADPLLDDEISNTNDDSLPPPASKKPRVERKIHFTTLRLHTRLVIYDYVGRDIKLPTIDFSDYYLFSARLFHLYLDDRNDPRSCYGRMSVVACVFGDLEALQYLNEIPCNPFVPGRYDGLLHKDCNMESICYILACNGHWNALKWAVMKQYPCEKYTLKAAVMGGADTATLSWLQSSGCKFQSRATFVAAIKRGDIDVMRWLRVRKCPMDAKIFQVALLHGNLNILDWLKEENCRWDESLFRAAAEKGDREVLQWLRMEKCPLTSDTFNHAISYGADLATLQWFLHEDKSLMDDESFILAVRRGDEKILEWLHSMNCKMCEDDFAMAIMEDAPWDILTCMHRVGCPWNEDTFEAAVRRGDWDWDILMWMRENKCPWDARCINFALECEMFDIVEWLEEENCPHDEHTHSLLKKKIDKIFNLFRFL